MHSSRQHGNKQARTGKHTIGMRQVTVLPSTINLNLLGLNSCPTTCALLHARRPVRREGKPQPNLAQSASRSHHLQMCRFAPPHPHPKTTLTSRVLSPQTLPLPRFRSLWKLSSILEVPVTSDPLSRHNHNVHISRYLPTHLHSQQSTHNATKAPSGLGPALPFPSPLPNTLRGPFLSPSVQLPVHPATPVQHWVFLDP